MRWSPALFLSSGFVLGMLSMWAWRVSVIESGQEEVRHSSSDQRIAGARGARSVPAGNPGLKETTDSLLIDGDFLQALADPSRRAAALRARVTEILSIPQPGRRHRAFSLMLAFAEKGDLAAIHRGMMDLEKTRGLFPAEYEAMMHRMAEVDGTEVMSRLSREMGVDRPMLSWQTRCVANWAGADADAAIRWWNSLPEGAFRNSCASPLIEGLAWQEAGKAWETAKHLDPRQRADATWLVAAEMAKQQGVTATSRWLAGLGEEDYNGKMGVLRKLVDFVRHQPGETKRAIIDQFQNEPWALQSDSFGALGEDWGSVAGREAAEWAAGLSEQAMGRALPRVVRSWSKVDPAKAADWMAAQTGSPLYPVLRNEFLNQIRLTTPDQVTKWEAALSTQ